MENLSFLQDTALFVEVARQGGFKKASDRLGVPPATLSRRIATLEKTLGIRLFNRTTRSVELTTTGVQYFESCAHLIDDLLLAQEDLKSVSTVPEGKLKITMPVDLGVSIIGPLLSEFSAQYPDVVFDIDLSARNIDFHREQFDLGIRIGEIEDEQLIARKLGTIRFQLYASKKYLDRYGRPSEPNELTGHSCLLAKGSNNTDTWTLHFGNKKQEAIIKGRFLINNLGLLLKLALKDLGIVALPGLLIDKHQELECVLPEWELPSVPINAVMLSRLQPAHARAFLDYLTGRLDLL